MAPVLVALAVVQLALIDSSWAIPLNTLLLVVLAIVSARNGQKLNATKDIADSTHAEVKKTHISATHAAEAASYAAAAARDAARVAKDVGGALRATTVPTDPTDTVK